MDSLNFMDSRELQPILTKSDKRKRIWEIPSDFFCSVCGTCLSLDEQRAILKKLSMDPSTFTLHQIHALMVQSLHTENKLSRRLDSHLNSKYRYEISHYANYNDDQFMAVWQEHMKSGDICGLYWVAASHQDLSETTLFAIFDDVHMLSHLNGGTARKEKAECERLSELNSNLSTKLQQIKKEKKELVHRLDSSEKARQASELKIRKIEKTILADPLELESLNHKISELMNENLNLQNALHLVKDESRDYLEHIKGFNKEKEQLISELSAQKEINLQLYREIESVLRHFNCDNTACTQTDCTIHLCEKRVLIVGGLTKLRGFYRSLVESFGGQFEYHDGYLHSGERELENLIKKCDIILCPVDCNSHGACWSVKKICNRINKPYHMLPSSSLSSISQALTAVSPNPPS
jgi:hypothetical protein